MIQDYHPRAALIDMDGTLYDSMGNHAKAWARLATELDIPVQPHEFYMYEGRTGASTINILFNRRFGRDATDEEVKELYHRKTVYFRELPDVHPMPGAAQLLEALRACGIRCVLVTGSGQSSLISRLDVDYPGIFAPDMRVTSANVTHGKPHPEPYLKAMEMAGVGPHESIAIENAPLGVESAHRSGAFTVAVTTGPIPKEAMVEAGADIVYDSMPECARDLPKLLYDV